MGAGEFSLKLREAVLRVIATVVVSMEEMHPNLRILMAHAAASLNMYIEQEEFESQMDLARKHSSGNIQLARKSRWIRLHAIH